MEKVTGNIGVRNAFFLDTTSNFSFLLIKVMIHLEGLNLVRVGTEFRWDEPLQKFGVRLTIKHHNLQNDIGGFPFNCGR